MSLSKRNPQHVIKLYFKNVCKSITWNLRPDSLTAALNLDTLSHTKKDYKSCRYNDIISIMFSFM